MFGHYIRPVREMNVGVLYASHYMEEIEAVCNRVAIIDKGKLLKMGTLDELLDRKRMDLGITVSNLPEDLIRKLTSIATVRTDDEGITSITIHESREAPAAGHPGECRARRPQHPLRRRAG